MLSKNNNFQFINFDTDFIKSAVKVRLGETKIGEKIRIKNPDQKTKYIILGIEESIGPQSNRGLSGSENAFKSFLPFFLNMQENGTIEGDEILLIGSIKSLVDYSNEKEGRIIIEELDDFVLDVLKPYLEHNFIPIVIGGGHNNAYPLIKSFATRSEKSISVINLDPHADCRPLEGRHSGNPFSYAKENGFLNHYTVIGLHKAYNSSFIYSFLDANKFDYSYFESYIDDLGKFQNDLQTFKLKYNSLGPFGIEMDLDSIAFMPSSAYTPSGFTLNEARSYIRNMSELKNCCYLHLPEGAPKTETEEKIVGKSLAYLVWDFIEARNKLNT